VARPLARLVDLDAHVSYHEWNYKGEKELEDKQRIKDYLKNWIKDGENFFDQLSPISTTPTPYPPTSSKLTTNRSEIEKGV